MYNHIQQSKKKKTAWLIYKKKFDNCSTRKSTTRTDLYIRRMDAFAKPAFSRWKNKNHDNSSLILRNRMLSDEIAYICICYFSPFTKSKNCIYVHVGGCSTNFIWFFLEMHCHSFRDLGTWTWFVAGIVRSTKFKKVWSSLHESLFFSIKVLPTMRSRSNIVYVLNGLVLRHYKTILSDVLFYKIRFWFHSRFHVIV